MTIRSDSFSSTAEVTAYTRHLLDGQTAFNSTTRPTVTEVEKFIDRASGELNTALAMCGFSPSLIYANSTAKLSCDQWVTMNAAKNTELTQRGTGYSEADGSRIAAFETESAYDFVKDMSLGFTRLGIAQTYRKSDGLQYTGLTVQSERDDPVDSSLEQPKISRGQWDNA